MFGELDGRASHPSLTANDGDSFSSFQCRILGHGAPCGHERTPGTPCLFMAETLWLAHQTGSRNRDVLGMRAIPSEADIASGSPNLLADPIRRTVNDNSRIVAPWNSWKSCLLHPSGNVFNIAWVHGRGH